MRITTHGEYVTRDGSHVTVHAIEGPSSFPVKGAVWRMFRGKFRPRGYEIWALDGRFHAVGEHSLDIVAERES